MRTAGPSNIHNRHRTPFTEQVRESVRISDIVLELLDARYPVESRIPEMEKYALEMNKKLIFLITKADLVPAMQLKEKISSLNIENPVIVSSLTKQGISKLRERIIIESKRLKQTRKTHVTLVGYPNSGKSTLINLLVRRNAAPVSSQAGWTKSVRRIRLSKDILIIDVPGIIQKEENLFQGVSSLLKHSKIGAQNPESVREPDFIVASIMKENPGLLESHYFLEKQEDPEVFLEELARKKNLMKKKALPDIDRTARQVLKDWQNGLIRKKAKN